MAKRTVQKTRERLIRDLDDELYLLRVALSGFESGEAAHSKTLAGVLRNLVCYVSGSEGLLWRLTESAVVNDVVKIQSPGRAINEAEPLMKGLDLSEIPLFLAGEGPTELAPRDESLKQIIKFNDAYYVGGQGYSYEKLIQRVAGQTGLGHELDQADRIIAELEEIRFGSTNALGRMLILIAKLTLDVGDRVVKSLAEDLGVKLAERSVPQFEAPTTGGDEPHGFKHPEWRPAPEGSLSLMLSHAHGDWRKNDATYTFGPFERGALRVSMKKLPDLKMEIVVEGLDAKALHLHAPTPEPSIRPELMVFIVWDNENVRLTLDTQVSEFERVGADES